MITIVIPTYIPESRLKKGISNLVKCLHSIKKYTLDYKVIVVANGCDPSVRTILDFVSDDKITYVWFDKGLGYTKATNEGIKRADTEFVVLLNDDVILLPQSMNYWIYALRQPLDEEYKNVISGPHELTFAGKRFLVGFCLMIRKSFLDTYGILDESFNPGAGEDMDICWRAEKHGLGVVCVDKNLGISGEYVVGHFPIFHEGEATFNDFPDLVKVCQKNYPMIEARVRAGFYNPL